MVFIPGLTFSGEIFKNQLEYFSSEYRVIAIDPRGQGYSAKTVDGNDYLTHGRDVAGLIDAYTKFKFSINTLIYYFLLYSFIVSFTTSSQLYFAQIKSAA